MRKHYPEIGDNPDNPPCPNCKRTRVKKDGCNKGQQRYLCGRCGASFGENSRRVRDERPHCPRCLRRNCKVESGKRLRCGHCRYLFRRGDREDLCRNLPILEARVKALNLPPILREEVLQNAALDVLRGAGTCRNVYLDKSKAYRYATPNPKHISLEYIDEKTGRLRERRLPTS